MIHARQLLRWLGYDADAAWVEEETRRQQIEELPSLVEEEE